MTPCEKLGYKVGDEFEVIDDYPPYVFDAFIPGDRVYLSNDDGSKCPGFTRYSDGRMRYMLLHEVKKITTENDWIEWHGGECPVDGDVVVETKWSDGDLLTCHADDYDWRHDEYENIIAYRLSAVEKEASPGADEGKAGVSTDTPTVTRHDIIDAIYETGAVIDLTDAMEIAETIVSKFELKRVEK